MGFKIKTPTVAGWNPGKTVSGIFNNPGKELKNSATNTFGFISPLMALMNSKGPKPPDAGEDPQVTALRKRLFGEAQQFEKDLPGLQKQAGNQIEAEGDMALRSGIKGTRENFNRRGLLYSGLRQAGEQDVRGRVASTMAGQRAQANQDLSKLAMAKATKAAQVGLQGYQDAVNREAEIAGVNLQNQVARAQMMQQLGQIGGYAAGSYFGSRMPATQSNGLNADGSISTIPAGYDAGMTSRYPYNSNQYRNDNYLNIGPFDQSGRLIS